MMANGMAAGVHQRARGCGSARLVLPLCAAWPPQYALTVDYPIVGNDRSMVRRSISSPGSSPFIATGITPDTMTIGEITGNEPCLGRGSVVSSAEGAYYASPNGIIKFSTGVRSASLKKIYEKEFHNSLLPGIWAKGKFGESYTAFLKEILQPQAIDGLMMFNGFVFDEVDPNTPFAYVLYAATRRGTFILMIFRASFSCCVRGGEGRSMEPASQCPRHDDTHSMGMENQAISVLGTGNSLRSWCCSPYRPGCKLPSG